MIFKIIIISIVIVLINFAESQETSPNKPLTAASPSTSSTSKPLTADVAKSDGNLQKVLSNNQTSSKENTTNCVCDGALLPGKEVEICAHCKCKYDKRNTTLIKVVVIIVIWVISILVIYMLFLMCLDPLLNKRVKANYEEHTNEDDDNNITPPTNSQEMNTRGANVLNRVTNQTDKWKKQVREQRRNIYDRRSMLN